MKKDLLCISIVFLALSMIISAYIISKSLSEETYMNGNLSGALTVMSDDTNFITSDVLNEEAARAMFGYAYDYLIQMIRDGNLEHIPYIEFGDNYIFSKKALEEWVYSRLIK